MCVCVCEEGREGRGVCDIKVFKISIFSNLIIADINTATKCLHCGMC